MKTLKNLQARHHTIKRLKALGNSNAEIADKTGLSKRTIESITSSTLFKKALKDFISRLDAETIEQTTTELISDPVKAVFEDANVTAAEKIVDLMSSAESEPTQRNCALDVLSFTGYSPKETTVTNTAIFIGDKQAIVLQEALDDISLAR